MRASDEDESQGVNDAIIAMVTESMRMPNSIVVCLADSTTESAAGLDLTHANVHVAKYL